MTRFARFGGSKGHNKRTVEEASSWQDIKADIQLNESKNMKSENVEKTKGEITQTDDLNKHLDISKIKKSKRNLENNNALEQKKTQKKIFTENEASSWQEMKTDIQLNECKIKKSENVIKTKGEITQTEKRENVEKTKGEITQTDDLNKHLDISKIKKSKRNLENNNALEQQKAKKKIFTENEASSWQEMKTDIQLNECKIKKSENLIKTKGEITQTDDSNKHLDISKIKNSKRNLENNNALEQEKAKKKKKIFTENEASSWQEMKTELVESKENDPLDKKESTKAKNKKNVKTDYIIENDIKYKVFKSGEKKEWFDLHYEENDIMTRYKKFWVKRIHVPELDAFRKSLEEKGLPQRELNNKMLHEERKKHNKLRVELMYEQIYKRRLQKSQENQISDISIPKKANRNKPKFQFHKNKNEQINQQNFKRTKKNQKDKFISKMVDEHKQEFQCYTNEDGSLKFEENDLMTKFDGYWILKNNLEYLNKTFEMKREKIVNERLDGNKDPNLTSDEELIHRRLMKKEKRREHKLLVWKLSKLNKFKMMKNLSTKNGSYQSSKGSADSNIVKFQGYFVRKEGAERLHQLKDKMEQEGATEEEIQNALKTQRRQEENHLKRLNNIVCFKCRGVGHVVENCPENISEGSTEVKICYKCGSTEHTSQKCPAGKGDTYTYATCYICGESGHISRECPDNPRGLYPNDGCCNNCGSVEHLKRDCPELQVKSASNTITLPLYQGQSVEDLEVEVSEDNDKPTEDKMAKIIKFDY